MSCCTSNAWGDLKNPDYKEKGQVEKVEDLDIYRVGSSSNGKCIIWCYDVFGFKVIFYAIVLLCNEVLTLKIPTFYIVLL